MRIRAIDTQCRRDVQQFVRFPFDLYRGCPQWVPPFLSDVRLCLDRRRHPFYRESVAEFFLAESEGQVLGRLAVMDDRRANQHFGTRTAAFGFFDAADDRQVSRGLFDAACDWARARGLDEMAGVRGLSSLDASGVLVEGFEHRAVVGLAYNHPCYDGLIRDSGFQPDGEHVSGYLSGDHELPARFFELADRVKARRGLWVKTFRTKREIRVWVPRIAAAYRGAFVEHGTSLPPTEDEVAQMARTLILIADPRLPKLVMKGDEVIGFLFAYPDVAAALQRAGGRLWPLGWYHILRERTRTEWVNFNGVGVLPAYQGMGASVMLYAEVARTIRQFHFRHADVVQVGVENAKSLADMEAIGVRWYKRHRNYRRAL